jgi:competence ComEA-like helix-hairpin-helix protein
MKITEEFFSWSKQERMAVIVLSVLLLLLFSGDILFKHIYPYKDLRLAPDSLAIYLERIDRLERDLASRDEEAQSVKQVQEKPKIRPFDPNDLDLKGWQEMGFSQKQSESLLKYKKLIDGFDSKKDLAEAFVVSEEKFRELEPYIAIKDSYKDRAHEITEEYASKISEKVEIESAVYLELNSCDSISLLQLKGIGPFYAGKIISYRKELGAYVSMDQLLEIWHFDTLKLKSIRPYIWVDSTRTSKLNINLAAVDSLRRHPYISWNQANAIVNYRDQHGQFTSIEDLSKIMIFNDSIISKLEPYIRLD